MGDWEGNEHIIVPREVRMQRLGFCKHGLWKHENCQECKKEKMNAHKAIEMAIEYIEEYDIDNVKDHDEERTACDEESCLICALRSQLTELSDPVYTGYGYNYHNRNFSSFISYSHVADALKIVNALFQGPDDIDYWAKRMTISAEKLKALYEQTHTWLWGDE
jgi:hypothetical protein